MLSTTVADSKASSELQASESNRIGDSCKVAFLGVLDAVDTRLIFGCIFVAWFSLLRACIYLCVIDYLAPDAEMLEVSGKLARQPDANFKLTRHCTEHPSCKLKPQPKLRVRISVDSAWL